MSQKRRWLKLTFESDWHIGTGAGIPGSVDRQVLRDGDGLPYVPGKTLTGILRDAAEWVAGARDQLEGGHRWKDALASLFGEQPENYYNRIIPTPREARPAKIGVGSARLSEDVRQCVIDADKAGRDSGLALSSALVQVHPGVKIDPKTGRVQDDRLFSTERARRDCKLYAEVTYLDGDLNADEEALLDDAIKAVRRIGGKRRRGAGVCRLAWKGDPFIMDGTGRMKAPLNLKGIQPKGDAVSLEVKLTALQPIIINRKSIGNAIEAETEIPGAFLLSYYVQEVLYPLGEERLRKAIMSGEISASTFLPEFEGRAALPAPLCLTEEKEEKGGKKEIINGLMEALKPGVQTKDLRSGYVVPHKKGMTYYAASDHKIIRTHNTIDDDVQRPTENVGGLFTYEAIQAGMVFRGALKIGADLWNEIRARDDILDKLAADEHTFGRSRKDEYGQASLECVGLIDDEGELYQTALIGGQTKKTKGNNEKYLVVYLASDLLLRDEALGYSVNVKDVRQALEKALGVELGDIPQDEWSKPNKQSIQISPLGGSRGHAVRTGRRESWQRSWGLPRPSMVYFKAGSAFLFKVMEPATWDEGKAEDLIRDGLGERRAEGYGRVLLNPPFLCGGGKVVRPDKPGEQGGKPKEDIRATLPKLEEEQRFVTSLAEDAVKRRFRQLARQEAYKIVHDNHENAVLFKEYHKVRWYNRPNLSHFGPLLEAAATIEGGGHGRDVFLKWVESIGKHKEKDGHWDEYWCAMFASLGSEPQRVWELRPAFGDLKEAALKQGILKEDQDGDLNGISPSLLGGFLELLCDAVFDRAKQRISERGGGQA